MTDLNFSSLPPDFDLDLLHEQRNKFKDNEEFQQFSQSLLNLHKGHLQLKRFSETIRMGRTNNKPTAEFSKAEKVMCRIAEEARCFVFHFQESKEVLSLPKGSTTEDPLSLPFPVCFFEAAATPLFMWGNGKGFKIISGLGVIEEAPNKYCFMTLEANYYGASETVTEIRSYDDDNAELRYFLGISLDRLSKKKSDIGIERTNERYRTKNGVRKIRHVVHVVPKTFQRKIKGSSRKIDWSHRWEVRGHWRGLFVKNSPTEIDPKRLGKNRDGEFCVYGYTWVSECEKGPEHAPLVKKVRVVGEENYSPDLQIMP